MDEFRLRRARWACIIHATANAEFGHGPPAAEFGHGPPAAAAGRANSGSLSAGRLRTAAAPAPATCRCGTRCAGRTSASLGRSSRVDGAERFR